MLKIKLHSDGGDETIVTVSLLKASVLFDRGEPSSYIDAWIAVTQPKNWSAEKTARLKKLFSIPSNENP